MGKHNNSIEVRMDDPATDFPAHFRSGAALCDTWALRSESTGAWHTTLQGNTIGSPEAPQKQTKLLKHG